LVKYPPAGPLDRQATNNLLPQFVICTSVKFHRLVACDEYLMTIIFDTLSEYRPNYCVCYNAGPTVTTAYNGKKNGTQAK
jgi:hypothetical protein